MRGMLMSLTTMSMSRFAASRASASTPSWANRKLTVAVADLAAEFLQDQRLQVRLVVDDQDARGHAALPSDLQFEEASASPRPCLPGRPDWRSRSRLWGPTPLFRSARRSAPMRSCGGSDRPRTEA